MGKACAASCQEDSEDWNSLEKHLRPPERKKLLAISFVVIVVALATLGFCYYLYDSWNRGTDLSGGWVTERITYTGYAWATSSGTTVSNITLTIKNTGGPAELSVVAVRVNDTTTGVMVKEMNGASATFPKVMAKGAVWSFVVSITGNFQRGTQYNFMVVTSIGNQFGPYEQIAP